MNMSEGMKQNTPSRRHQAERRAAPRATTRYSAALKKAITHKPWHRDEDGRPIGWHREHLLLASSLLAVILVVAVVIPAAASALGRSGANAPMTMVPLPLPALAANSTQAAPAPPNWQQVTVQPGQTLSQIFDAQGLGYGALQRVLNSADSDDAQALEEIHPHDELAFLLDHAGELKSFRFDRDDTHRVVITIDGDSVRENVHKRATSHRVQIAHAVIHGSLFAAGLRAGMSEAMVLQMADVFKYDIDFIKNIRDGDSFTVIYDNIYRDGALLHHGDILAAEFWNQGKRYTAYRFTLPSGNVDYYSEDGRPLRKSLLRTPVKFTRISSRFSRARKHPILGYTRAHKGVDYAAPKGTPIHAAGDGVIKVRGWVHGFGRFILLKNTSKYSTAYAHMSRFAKGLHVGSHVRQGQIIGYVGMTGLATGPHLHYEVRVNGRQENPLTVTMPKPQPLAPKLLAEFHASTAPMLARLKAIDSNVRLAQAGTAGAATLR